MFQELKTSEIREEKVKNFKQDKDCDVSDFKKLGLKSLLRLAKVLKGKVHINFHWPDSISTEILSVNLLRQLQRKSS